MQSRRFAVKDTVTGPAVVDGDGRVWASVPRSVDDPAGTGRTLLTIARKAYELGLADAYANGRRSFHVARGDDGEGGRTWDLMSTAKEVRRLASQPRRGWRPWRDPVPRLLADLATRAHAAALSDARSGGGAPPFP